PFRRHIPSVARFSPPVDSAGRGALSASRTISREIPPSPLLSDVIPRSPPATEESAVAFVVIPSETKCSEESLIAFSCGLPRPDTESSPRPARPDASRKIAPKAYPLLPSSGQEIPRPWRPRRGQCAAG